ncbi:hypothetical protein [Halomonas rhizosphaerae]|uniref:Uncharacterized protein n=1 Tax=Halomonas rhizosphaerae TaxID=3043296 RepID=A0ABT6UXD3_9GAMM|nr:hypothetical protein [Halomonas rhizosphaerae]MDI5890638.1 hypothetical protein [Halomonas rhizosphaerae]
MIPQTSTAQRMIGTFATHGITSGMLVQLQHLQELALAINLQGQHLIHLDLFGQRSGVQQLTIAGCARENHWRPGIERTPRYLIEIPAGGDEMVLRDVQAELGNAAADLMQLLGEDAQ